jgi:hypothetical protein
MEGRTWFALHIVIAGNGIVQIEETELSNDIIAGISINMRINK